jgi:hypothetical protein
VRTQRRSTCAPVIRMNGCSMRFSRLPRRPEKPDAGKVYCFRKNQRVPRRRRIKRRIARPGVESSEVVWSVLIGFRAHIALLNHMRRLIICYERYNDITNAFYRPGIYSSASARRNTGFDRVPVHGLCRISGEPVPGGPKNVNRQLPKVGNAHSTASEASLCHFPATP